MATLDDVSRMVSDLPEAIEGDRRGSRTWTVDGKVFAWERQFSKADIKRFGGEPVPDGPILAVRVEDLGEKEAVLSAEHDGFFTIPHFDGFAAVLIQLSEVSADVLRDTLVDAWLSRAPANLAQEFLKSR
jgi:hypothetical protein